MVSEPLLYIGHILTEISVLETILAMHNYETFRVDPICFRASAYCVQCISEATKNLPVDILEQYPNIRWRDIRGIGNHTRHEYSNLLPFLIWDIMVDHLPALKNVMQELQSNIQALRP
jgi:uncharacterized protein with HEPN domain